jgi:acyl-[acyl-carrier-protein]-phospholipid O-acyltransferase / long-chain-fatty-acid--[acyl-carrier-protein] ligase
MKIAFPALLLANMQIFTMVHLGCLTLYHGPKFSRQQHTRMFGRRASSATRITRHTHAGKIKKPLTMPSLSQIPGEIVAFTARFLLRLFYRARCVGRLPRSDRMLIICNHQSFLDGVVIGAFLPLSPTYLIHSSIANKWYFKFPLLFLRHKVVDTNNPLAIKALVALVEEGHPVVIFPEGRITQTGALMKIYDGPAFVAAKTGCKVIPLHIDGPVYSPFSRMKGDFPQRAFPRITLTIHPGVVIPMPEGRTAKQRRRLASDQMRRVLQDAAFRSRKQSGLFEALLDAVELQGKDRDMLEDINASPVSYAGILKGSLALGRLITKFSAERENVGVLLPNVNATVYVLLGMFAMRRTPAMLNFTAGLDAMQNACRISDVKTVLTSRAFVEKAKLGDLISQLRSVQVLYLEDLRTQFGIADKLWLILWALRNPRRVMRPAQPDDPAVILFTSGSEGMPKGVVLSHGSILANVAQIGAAFSFSSKEKFMSALPLFHAFGLTAGLLLPLLKGCRMFLYPSPLHYRAIPEIVYDRDCTVLFATNTFLSKYAQVAHPYDFYSVKYLVVGAEKLTEDVQRLCVEKFGIKPYEGYGATECSPVISVNTPMASRPGTVGELLPGIEYKVAPVPGVESGGVLHVRGDNLMLGYLKHDQPGVIQPPGSEFGPGWYNTGDVVTMETGFIRLQARLKRFAKVAGEMVSLELVEKVAITAKPDALHAASSYRDTRRGEVVILFTQDRNLKREDLQMSAREMGAPELAIPRRIIPLDRIPMLGNGKKDYVTMEKMAAELASQPEVSA